MTEQQRLAIFEDKKMDAVYLEDFTEEYAALSPEKFVEEILVKRFRAKLIVIGYDYTFGKMGRSIWNAARLCFVPGETD